MEISVGVTLMINSRFIWFSCKKALLRTGPPFTNGLGPVSGAGDAYRLFFSRFRSENETTVRPETERGGVAYEKIVKAKGFRTFSFTICQYIRVLLFLMTVLAQTFLPLVRSHLMTLMLLSVRHSCKFNGLTLSLDPVRPYFTFAAKALGGLERGDVVCRNRNRGILRNIAGYLRGALLDDEAAEAAEIYVVLLLQRSLDALHESLDNGLYLYLLGTGAFGDLVYDICFCHSCKKLRVNMLIPFYPCFCHTFYTFRSPRQPPACGSVVQPRIPEKIAFSGVQIYYLFD